MFEHENRRLLHFFQPQRARAVGAERSQQGRCASKRAEDQLLTELSGEHEVGHESFPAFLGQQQLIASLGR